MDDVYFIQLSDLHFLGSRDERYLPVDPAANARRVLAHVRHLNVRPAFCLLSGDLVNGGSVAAYRKVRDLADEIEALGMPVLPALGNHDGRAAFRQVFLAGGESDPFFYEREVSGVRLLVLDSLVPDQVHGELGQVQLSWLRDALEQPAPGATVLVFHHPPCGNASPVLDSHHLADGPALAEVLAAFPVAGMLHGHTHCFACTTFAGVLSATAPGVAHLMDPSQQEAMVMLEGAGYNFGCIRGGRLTVHPMILPGEQRVLYRLGARHGDEERPA